MMTKIVDFLEQQVQWVAIGIAALYLAFTIWSYVINNPITTEVHGATADLGNVDQMINQSAAQPLKQAMESTAVVPELTHKPEFSNNFEQRVVTNRDQYKDQTLGEAVFDSPTATGTATQGPEERVTGVVRELPTPPTPQLVGVLAGRAEVQTPGGGSTPPPPVAGGTPGNAQQQGVEDKNWVTIEGKISIAPLGPMMAAAKFPAADQTTEFLRLEVQREEKQPDGTWGEPTVVQPPLYLGIPAWPAMTNPAAAIQYLTWAKSNVLAILQPPFYQVVKGTPWYLPSDTATAAAIATPNGPAFDPTNLKMIPKTPDEKKARLDYLNSQQYRDLIHQQHSAPAGPPAGEPAMPPPGGGGFGPNGMAPQGDPADRAVLAQAMFGVSQVGGIAGPGGGMMAPPQPGQEQPNQIAAPNLQSTAAAAVQKANAALPQGGIFDPSKQPDVSCWGFDDTVMPGKTYRYRIRYMVSNPAHGNPGLAGTPQVKDALAMISGYSTWSDAVTVQPVVQFFVATGISSGERVNFKIYKWQDGEISAVSEQDGAGDIIGAAHADSNGINYTTPWTMVAVRPDYDGENFVLLVGPGGQMIRRDYRHDQLNPEYRDLQRQVAAEAAANTANNNNNVNNNAVQQQRPPMYQPMPGPGRGGR